MKKSLTCCSHFATVPSEHSRLHSRDENIFCAFSASAMSAADAF
jgi:hypothetical protein